MRLITGGGGSITSFDSASSSSPLMKKRNPKKKPRLAGSQRLSRSIPRRYREEKGTLLSPIHSEDVLEVVGLPLTQVEARCDEPNQANHTAFPD